MAEFFCAALYIFCHQLKFLVTGVTLTRCSAIFVLCLPAPANSWQLGLEDSVLEKHENKAALCHSVKRNKSIIHR